MRLLLDSHVLLWALLTPQALNERARDLLQDTANDVLFSAVNLWELAIKRAKGGIDFVDAVVLEAIEVQGFDEVPVTTRYGLAAAALPRRHNDPFDRMLIAQARLEGLTLVTRDRIFHDYDVDLLEA